MPVTSQSHGPSLAFLLSLGFMVEFGFYSQLG